MNECMFGGKMCLTDCGVENCTDGFNLVNEERSKVVSC